MTDLVLGPTDFVAVFNQTINYAYPYVRIAGELANFRISKNKWVYFDLKDEQASVKFFGTVYQLPGPLEDGLLLEVNGTPRLHEQYGFAVNIQSVRPTGEGSIKRASLLLEAKLAAEGLFDPARKRSLPYPPTKIGLITSGESAAYHDFIKILNERWGGVEVQLADIQVQGEVAIAQILAAIEYFNTAAQPPDVLVITRGGGSADDLAVFNTEQVTRVISASRVPTLVAIGHEVDVSLAEMASDQRASTPSNAAQILVPDRRDIKAQLLGFQRSMQHNLRQITVASHTSLKNSGDGLQRKLIHALETAKNNIAARAKLLEVLNPEAPLKRGYALVLQNRKHIKSVADTQVHNSLQIRLQDGQLDVNVAKIDSY